MGEGKEPVASGVARARLIYYRTELKLGEHRGGPRKKHVTNGADFGTIGGNSVQLLDECGTPASVSTKTSGVRARLEERSRRGTNSDDEEQSRNASGNAPHSGAIVGIR